MGYKYDLESDKSDVALSTDEEQAALIEKLVDLLDCSACLLESGAFTNASIAKLIRKQLRAWSGRIGNFIEYTVTPE